MQKKSLILFTIIILLTFGYKRWWAALIVTLLFCVLLYKRLSQPEVRSDYPLLSGNTQPVVKKKQSYWLIAFTGITDLILITLEIIVEFSGTVIDMLFYLIGDLFIMWF